MCYEVRHDLDELCYKMFEVIEYPEYSLKFPHIESSVEINKNWFVRVLEDHLKQRLHEVEYPMSNMLGESFFYTDRMDYLLPDPSFVPNVIARIMGDVFPEFLR